MCFWAVARARIFNHVSMETIVLAADLITTLLVLQWFSMGRMNKKVHFNQSFKQIRFVLYIRGSFSLLENDIYLENSHLTMLKSGKRYGGK